MGRVGASGVTQEVAFLTSDVDYFFTNKLAHRVLPLKAQVEPGRKYSRKVWFGVVIFGGYTENHRREMAGIWYPAEVNLFTWYLRFVSMWHDTGRRLVNF